MFGRGIGAALLPLLLCGCASVFPNSKTYHPVVIRVDDEKQYFKDMAECHAVADNYRPGVNTGNLAQSTFNGAAGNAGLGVINPLAPAAGAVAGGLNSLIADVGITGNDSITILVRCILEETRRDRSAVIADPH